MPKFSIITVNFNSGEKLARTIASVLDQGEEFEYILVDGLSKDVSLLAAIAASHKNPGIVSLISEPDDGIYDAMNKAIERSSGEYLLFVGAGDLMRPGVLKAVKEHLPSHSRGFVYGDVMWAGRRYDGEFDKRKLCGKNVCHQSIFYGREVFERLGGYDVKYKQWADWVLNMSCFGDRMIEKRYVPVVVADFEDGGCSSLGDKAYERDRLDIIRNNLGISMYLREKLPMMMAHLGWRVASLANGVRSLSR